MCSKFLRAGEACTESAQVLMLVWLTLYGLCLLDKFSHFQFLDTPLLVAGFAILKISSQCSIYSAEKDRAERMAGPSALGYCVLVLEKFVGRKKKYPQKTL